MEWRLSELGELDESPLLLALPLREGAGRRKEYVLMG